MESPRYGADGYVGFLACFDVAYFVSDVEELVGSQAASFEQACERFCLAEEGYACDDLVDVDRVVVEHSFDDVCSIRCEDDDVELSAERLEEVGDFGEEFGGEESLACFSFDSSVEAWHPVEGDA